jgi:hypothetical protein
MVFFFFWEAAEPPLSWGSFFLHALLSLIYLYVLLVAPLRRTFRSAKTSTIKKCCTYNCIHITVDHTFVSKYLEYGVTANITAFHRCERGSSGFDSPYSNTTSQFNFRSRILIFFSKTLTAVFKKLGGYIIKNCRTKFGT